MANPLTQQINVELAQLDMLLATYAELLARVRHQAPDVVELAALATVLHSFYNGAEGVFLIIARQLDRQVPDDPRWHRALLEQMARPEEVRPAVISTLLETRLTDYLAFRHSIFATPTRSPSIGLALNRWCVSCRPCAMRYVTN